MNTGLKNDEQFSVQPTRVGDYILNNVYNVHVGDKKKVNDLYFKNSTNNKNMDVESDLLLLGQPLGRSEYVPESNEETITNIVNKQLIPETEYTREKKPCNMPGTFIDRFEHPFVQPQLVNHIIMDEEYRGGFQSRLDFKDSIAKK